MRMIHSAALLAALTQVAPSGGLHAQTFPLDKPVRLVVPYPPGGSADALARLIAYGLSPRLGKPVVVDNIAGASGNIGTHQVARAAPDGHTLVLAATPLSTNPSFYKDIPFDVVKDLSAITHLTRQAFVLVVHPSVAASTVPELIALAKSQPGKLTFASHSAGGATHLAGELFKILAGIDMLHVPYKGQAPASADMVAGRVSMLFDSASTAMPQVSSGRLKALATTGPNRTPLVANGSLPAMAEFKGMESFNVIAWYGIMGPAGVPGPVLERLATEINATVRAPEVTQKLNGMGFEVVGTGETFTVEYVTGKSWSAYNWYQGGFRSVIQVNTDLPISVDRAIDLACHEGYPGHHVYNALLEKHLVEDRGWPEFTVYPLFSPQSLIAEGTANYGIEVAFPGDERLRFERERLYPLAGLDPARAAEYDRVRRLVDRLSHAGNDAARRYLEGRTDAAQAAAWLEQYALMPADRARQRIRFFDQYRSYVLNYTIGQDMVREYIESRGGTPDHPGVRWREFTRLLASPRLPGGLKANPGRPGL